MCSGKEGVNLTCYVETIKLCNHFHKLPNYVKLVNNRNRYPKDVTRVVQLTRKTDHSENECVHQKGDGRDYATEH